MSRPDGRLEVRVLGPVEVVLDHTRVDVPGAKPRAVLTMLGLTPGDTVGHEVIVDTLWGHEPPRTAQRAVRTHVATLRGVLGSDAVVTAGTGWRLAADATDASAFRHAVEQGRDALQRDDAAGAAAAFDAALRSWRGPPVLPDTPRGQAQVTPWVEMHDAVVEDRFDALLGLGQATELVADLEGAVEVAPLRERRWGQLMLALYRSGRQADALAAFSRARQRLDTDLGVEPSARLHQLQEAILHHDPALDRGREASVGTSTLPAAPRPHIRHLKDLRTSFIGRVEERRHLHGLLRTGRLITIVGPGGMGKTRLAIAAAIAHLSAVPREAVFVDLSTVEAGYVVQAIAATLTVVAPAQAPLSQAVQAHLRESGMLLIVDNCEHVADAVAPFLEQLVAACPDVTVLATSRERLGLPGERVLRLPPLAVRSGRTDTAEGSEAVTLFLDRARSVTPGFSADPDVLGELCQRLDGMPLAIELAAARCGSLGVDGLLAGLDDRLRLLRGARGATARHRSLRAVLDWSHELLDDDERRVLRRVSVFAGSFDLDAAGRVVDDSHDGDPGGSQVADTVGRLVDKHLLVRHEDTDRSRWRMLEMVRDYAAEQLARSGELEAVRHRHLAWATDHAVMLEDALVAGRSWQAEFDAVADDLRAALPTSPDTTTPTMPGHRLGAALGHLAYARGFVSEAREHYTAAAARAPAGDAAALLGTAAGIAYAEMRADIAFDLYLRGADRAAAAGTPAGQAIALAAAAVLGGRAPGAGFAPVPTHRDLCVLAARASAVAPDDDEVVAAHLAAAAAWTGTEVGGRAEATLADQALVAARRAGDPVLVCAALDALTTVALAERRFRDAAALARQRLDLLGQLERHDPRAGSEISDVFHMAVETALAAGDLPAARAAAQGARDDPIGRGVPLMAASRTVLAAALLGAFDEVMVEAVAMRDAWDASGRPTAGWMAPALYAAGMVAGLRGDDAAFRSWADLARQATRLESVQGFAAFATARVALHRGDLDRAIEVVDTLPTENLGKFDAYARAVATEVVVVAGQADAAARIEAAVAAGRENDWAAASLARARGRLTGDPDALRDAAARFERLEARFEYACTVTLLDAAAADEGLLELAALGCGAPA